MIIAVMNAIETIVYRSLKKSGLQRGRSSPLKSLLFQASISNCLNCVHNCDDHCFLENKYVFLIPIERIV